MILSDLNLTFRRFAKQKLNTSFHIIGLSLGITVCLLIGLFLKHELSYDTYHKKADRIYRINSSWTDPGQFNKHYSTPTPLAATMRSEVTGTEAVAMWHPVDNAIIEINPQKRFSQNHVMVTEPEFLDVFDVTVLKGNAKQILKTPFQCLLTEETAKKFFGNEDPIGKTFKYKNQYNITVAGLIKDFPATTHMPATMLMSYIPDDNFINGGHDSWTFVSGTETFVVMPPGQDAKKLEPQLKKIADAKINSNAGMPKGTRSDFTVQPLSDIHFNSDYAGGGQWVPAVKTSWLWFFASIGLAVLILACINFVNLSTAQALTRAKEVGVRKSIGASRYQLVIGFLREAWVLAAIAGLISIVVAKAVLPSINTLLEMEIQFDFWHSPGIWISLGVGVLITGILAGLYPAWITARFNPVVVLKAGSTVAGDKGSAWLRRGLVVLQFSISVGLLVAVAVISQQVKFLHAKSLGFNKDNVLLVGGDRQKFNQFANELRQIPQVNGFTFENSAPSSDGMWSTVMSLTSGDDPNRTGVKLLVTDENYTKFYGLKLLAGRNLIPSDTSLNSESIKEGDRIKRVLVNENLVKTFKFESNEKAIGKRFWFGFGGGRGEIVGVLADFNSGSLHEAISPVLLIQAPFVSEAGIKIAANSNTPQVISNIESAWKGIYPDGVFEYRFLDEQINSFYKAETKLFSLFKIFSAMAMVICCLGLWGLASFAAEQRVKEIGIRKVLGASMSGLVALLSQDFLKMVGLALVIATPLAWYFMHQWLEGFAFRVNISYWIFVFTALVAIVITVLTVGFRAIRAASANPVDSLRNE